MKPLPPDYARPSLAEFLEASKTHTKDGYLPFVEGHEAELRKHYVAPESEAEPEPVLETAELAELDAELAAAEVPPPAAEEYFSPRAAMAKQAEWAPVTYVRPTLEEWQAAGYGKDLSGDALTEAHEKFFEAYEAEMSGKAAVADPASGELSPAR